MKIHDTGYPWPADWDFIANPMDELQTITDTTPPYFIPVNDEGDLAFAVNNSHTYFAPGTPVSGPVDIIARVQDEVASTTWSVTPDQISYEIHNDTLSTGEIVSFAFTGHLFWEDNVNVIYQDDATYKSYGDYNTRAFYFIVTNTDGDSVVEASDADRAWQTQNFNNGAWWVRVTARDHGGNVTKDSMQVVTANYFSVAGTMGLCDGAPDSSGTLITAPDLPGSPLTTTDARGRFALNGAILGATHLRVSRPGYATLDTTFSVPSAPVVSELGLNYRLGDVNHDQVYDVLDVVGLIGVVFRGSTQPLVPYWSGDMDFNRVYDILDVVQLIGVAFRGNPDPGPPPCEP
ncbi:MAG: hypothetical protein HY304_00085 [candidate division Zixibacteria bacterium]|nr:hypothetical protein [candidate division Zixibacteria bacterium]